MSDFGLLILASVGRNRQRQLCRGICLGELFPALCFSAWESGSSVGGGVPPPPLAGVMADSGQRGCRFCLWAQTPHRVLLRSLPAGPGGPLGPPPKHAPSLHGHCVLPVPRVTRLHLRFPHHGAGITPFPVSPSSRPRRAVCRRRAWGARHPRASAWSPQRPARVRQGRRASRGVSGARSAPRVVRAPLRLCRPVRSAAGGLALAADVSVQRPVRIGQPRGPRPSGVPEAPGAGRAPRPASAGPRATPATLLRVPVGRSREVKFTC